MPLYFLHIPKTAGTSVTTWLHRQLGDDAVCPAKNWDQLTRIERKAFASYRAFAGHFGVDLQDFLDVKLLSACVFRDPIARTRSHYGHVVRDVGHPRHAHVSRQSFSVFVQDENNWPMIENFQARYLVRTPLRFDGFYGRLDDHRSKCSRLSVLSEDARYLLDPEYVREKSLEAFDEIDVVGVTEDLPAFLAALAKRARLGESDHRVVAPLENVAAPYDDQDRPDKNILDMVRSLTVLDRQLHQSACLRAS